MTQPGNTTLHLLCAGAAQGLVKALAPQLLAETGAAIDGRFGAVGAMKEALLAGERCDLMVLSQALVDDLVGEGRLRAEGAAPLGRVYTGVAVRKGAPAPAVGTPEALAAALEAADAIYFPDPERATAGIHFQRVLRELGLDERLRARQRTFPNGATAMRTLGEQGTPHSIGCTQVTEILYTEGVQLVGLLPRRFELATLYTAAVATAAAAPALAARFVAMLAAPEHAALRRRSGFEP
ncbi:MAG: substrate-binding domain-containing protein [Rubrivivax sp.]|nr:substrate-binding domain-containing protein [Rubrivivax sp.]